MGSAPTQQAQAIESQPIPTPAPPVTTNSAEVMQAQQDFTQQNLLKKSIKNTIHAGDSGGFGAPSAGANPLRPVQGKFR